MNVPFWTSYVVSSTTWSVYLTVIWHSILMINTFYTTTWMYIDEMGHSYFQSSDYLVIQGWIRTMHHYPTSIQLAGPNVFVYTKYLPEMVRHGLGANIIVPVTES